MSRAGEEARFLARVAKWHKDGTMLSHTIPIQMHRSAFESAGYSIVPVQVKNNNGKKTIIGYRIGVSII